MKHPYFAIFAQLLAQCRAYKALEISTIVDAIAARMVLMAYKALEISTIVDIPGMENPPLAYKALEISTIVDFIKLRACFRKLIKRLKFLLL